MRNPGVNTSTAEEISVLGYIVVRGLDSTRTWPQLLLDFARVGRNLGQQQSLRAAAAACAA
jgi:hypothetical protein